MPWDARRDCEVSRKQAPKMKRCACSRVCALIRAESISRIWSEQQTRNQRIAIVPGHCVAVPEACPQSDVEHR